MPQLRVYLIGAGVIAQTHAAAVQKLPAAQPVVLFVADPNANALADFKQRFPHAHTFNNARAMLSEAAEPDDIVVVATPPFTRFDLASEAINSGRHVLCDKPLAMSREQAVHMLELARSKDRFLGCCSCRFLGLPTSAETKRLIQTGTLGKLYHVSFINRQQRMRVGIEYQPTSRWFLDRSKNGGGTLMDWAPYDFTSLNDVLSPVRVDVVDAWMSTPITALDLPEGTVFDVEEHAGASLRYHLADGSVVPVTYERAACTHGEERSIVEIEGLHGAVSWDWLCFEGKGHVTHSYDQDGTVESNSTVLADESKLGFMDKPLVYFYRRIQGEQTPGVVNEQAVFNFSCIRAIYDCATSGQPQSVVLGANV